MKLPFSDPQFHEVLGAACKTAVNRALCVPNADGAAIALLDDSGTLRVWHVQHCRGQRSPLQDEELGPDSVAFRAVESASTQHSAGCGSHWPQSCSCTLGDMADVVAAPLMDSGEAVGALLVVASTPGALRDESIPLVEASADSLAHALQRWSAQKRFARLKQLYAGLRASNRLLVGRVRTVEGLYREACEICTREMNLSFAWIARPDKAGWFRTLAANGAAAEVIQTVRVSSRASRPEGQGSMGRAWRERRPVFVQNALEEANYGPWHDMLRAYGIHGMASVPLINQGRVEAVLAVGAPEPALFADEERVLFEEIGIDLSEALELLEAHVRNELASTAMEHSTTGVLVADGATQRVLYANPAMQALAGQGGRQLIGRYGLFFMPDDPTGRRLPRFRANCRQRKHWRGPVWGRRGDRVWEASATVRHVVGVDGVHRLIALFGPPPVAPDESLRDALTGLANARAFHQLLRERVADAGERGVVLVRVNVEDLTSVNSAYGRRGGDHVLSELSARLREALPLSTAIARLEGDNFAIVTRLMRRDALARAAQAILRRLEDAVVEPFQIDGHPVPLRIASGAALYPSDAGGPMALLERADEALSHVRMEYARSRAPRARGPIATRERLERAARLKRALHGTDAVRPWYQPKVRLKDRTLVGAEALARWWDGDAGWVSPAEFLPLAEGLGLMVKLNDRILRQTLCDIAAWRAARLAVCPVSVNLSPHQFVDAGLAQYLTRVLRSYRVPASLLHVEITEQAIITSLGSARAALERLAEAGIEASLDDFGTGYSSLSLLRELPLARLKLDKSFVHRLPEDSRALKVATLVIELAHSLDMSVVAEGIEYQRQAEILTQLGCDYGQGYFYAKPMPAADFQRGFLA